jgi:hypothetical protein
LDDIVAEAVNDQHINAESYIGDKLSSNDVNNLIVLLGFALQLTKAPHHVLYDTHSVLIESEGK